MRTILVVAGMVVVGAGCSAPARTDTAPSVTRMAVSTVSGSPPGPSVTQPGSGLMRATSEGPAMRTLHPRGFPVPRRQQVHLPTDVAPNSDTPVRMAVGDWFIAPRSELSRDNGAATGAVGASVGGVLVLAEATADTVTYQAVGEGRISLPVGPAATAGSCGGGATQGCVGGAPPPTVLAVVTAP